MKPPNGFIVSGGPKEAYLECMKDYLDKKTEYGWYVCLDNNKIIGGLGVIENDFHDRKDLTPNVCAVYTDEQYRSKGIAGKLLNMVVEDLWEKGLLNSPFFNFIGKCFAHPIHF